MTRSSGSGTPRYPSKVACYEAAADGQDEWPPVPVADALLDEFAQVDPTSGLADLVGWAAFAHVGV